MGKKANKDEVSFNYPIPKTLHHEVKKVAVELNIAVKDVMINALIEYVKQIKKELYPCPIQEYMEEEDDL